MTKEKDFFRVAVKIEGAQSRQIYRYVLRTRTSPLFIMLVVQSSLSRCAYVD